MSAASSIKDTKSYHLDSSRTGDVNDTVISCDVRDVNTVSDAADDTESLTVDSLEEGEDDDDLKHLNYATPCFTSHSENPNDLKYNNEIESKNKHETKIENTIDSENYPRWNGNSKPDLVTTDTNTNSSSNSTTATNNDSELCGTVRGTMPEPTKPTETHGVKTKSETLRSSVNSLESGLEQNLRNRDLGNEKKIMSQSLDRTTSETTITSTSSTSDNFNTLEEPGADTSRILRRPQSLTEEYASTTSSHKTFRRSGIPRRKSSEQSPKTIHSSALSTPVHSPGSLRKSLTLNSMDLAMNASPTSPRSLTKESPISPPTDPLRKSPSSSKLGDGLRKSPTSPADGMGKSPSNPRSVDCCLVGVSSRSLGPRTTSWEPGGGGCERSGSLCETMSGLSGSAVGLPVPVGRDTITSRLRIEKQHQCHDLDHHHNSYCGNSNALDLIPGGPRTYLTPSQRKDLTLRQLKGQVMHLTRQLEAREGQLQDLKAYALEEKEQIQTRLGHQLEETRGLAETARKEVTSLQESHEESVKMVATLQQQLTDVKKEMAERLARAEEIFLEMYNKGRESAIFEREEELELQGKSSRGMNATEAELRHKLQRTQAELAKWQTIQRRDSYHASPVPASEAETTLGFLKDSMFHFLTSDKTQTSDEHLRAVIRILKFSPAEKEKIAQAIVTKRNKAVL